MERRLTDGQNPPSYAEAEIIDNVIQDAELLKALDHAFEKDFDLPHFFGQTFNE